MSADPAHILVVDDDERIRALLRRYLSDNGFEVSVAADAAEARANLAALAVDLVVLDRMMPGEDGLALARSLRTAGNTVPILMLTAMGEAMDRIQGLEGGVDDYLTKPFEPKELVLRIAGILRRLPRQEAALPQGVLRFGRFSFDPARVELMDGDQPVHLTTAEASLLKVLAEAPGRVLTREEVAARTGVEGNLRTVDVQVTRLRRKLEDDPHQPRYVQTVRGRGYLLRQD